MGKKRRRYSGPTPSVRQGTGQDFYRMLSGLPVSSCGDCGVWHWQPVDDVTALIDFMQARGLGDDPSGWGLFECVGCGSHCCHTAEFGSL